MAHERTALIVSGVRTHLSVKATYQPLHNPGDDQFMLLPIYWHSAGLSNSVTELIDELLYEVTQPLLNAGYEIFSSEAIDNLS